MDNLLHSKTEPDVSLAAFVFLDDMRQAEGLEYGIKRRVALDHYVKSSLFSYVRNMPEQAVRAIIIVFQTWLALGEKPAFGLEHSPWDGVLDRRFSDIADDELGNIILGISREQLVGFNPNKAPELAREGKDKKQILQSFFDNCTLTRLSVCNFENVLAFGSRGEQVRLVQNSLNRVGLFKPSIPKLRPDGIYGSDTEQAVKCFQQLSMLQPDGIAGRRTVTRLFYACDKADRLLFCTISPQNFERIPVPGSKGEDTEQLQRMLMAICLFYDNLCGFYDALKAQLGFYGEETALCVSAVQGMLGSTVSGICSASDMIKIRSMYLFAAQYIPNIKPKAPYPGWQLTVGYVGDEVLEIGRCLLGITKMYCEIPSFFLCDVFTNQMQKAVFQFQHLFLSQASGIIDQTTWESIVQKSYDISVAKYCLGEQCPITQ